MANDSKDCPSHFQFHPCNPPYGMQYFNLDVLTPSMRHNTNDEKLCSLRDDKYYLSDHPEIKAIVAMIVKTILKYKPRQNLQGFLAQYFSQPKFELEQRMFKYLHKDKNIPAQNIKESPSEEFIFKGHSSCNFSFQGSEIRFFSKTRISKTEQNEFTETESQNYTKQTNDLKKVKSKTSSKKLAWHTSNPSMATDTTLSFPYFVNDKSYI